jgi:hypothetical protein
VSKNFTRILAPVRERQVLGTIIDIERVAAKCLLQTKVIAVILVLMVVFGLLAYYLSILWDSFDRNTLYAISRINTADV